MTDNSDEDEAGVFTLQGADGERFRCRVLEIFDFEDQDYAILMRLEPEDDQGMIVMRIVERGGSSVFQTIESEEDFERVIDYVHLLAERMLEQDDPLADR